MSVLSVICSPARTQDPRGHFRNVPRDPGGGGGEMNIVGGWEERGRTKSCLKGGGGNEAVCGRGEKMKLLGWRGENEAFWGGERKAL